MKDLILSAEQAEQVAAAGGPVAVRSEDGELVGFLDPASDAQRREVEEVRSRLGRPHVRYTTSEVLGRLNSGARP